MKNKFKLLLFLFLFMFCTMKVEAVTVTKSSVGSNTYIVGNHMFATSSTNSDFQKAIDSSDAIYSSSTGFRTEMIMLGASSIESDYKKMLIYYKGFSNDWYNPITFEELASSKVPSKFEIYYVNGVCVDPSCNGGTKTISFYYNNGYVTTPTQVNVNIGSPISASVIPNVQPPVGASLNYWSIKNISSAYDFALPVTTDLNLEANWNYYKYDITYVNTINNNATKTVNDCTFGSSTPCTYGDYNSMFGTVPIGYTFVGWSDKDFGGTVYKDLDSMKNLFGPSDSSITLYSVFESEDYIVNYDLVGGVFEDDTDISFNYTNTTTSISDLATPFKDGYTFDGWIVEGQKTTPGSSDNYVDSNGKLIINTPAKINLIAQWSPIKYYVEYNYTSPTGTGNESVTKECTYGLTCDISEFEDVLPEYKLLKYWNGTYDTQTFEIYNTFKNLIIDDGETVEVTPVLDDVKYRLSYNLNGGTLTNTNATSVIYNETVTLNAPTKFGYIFNKWTYTVGSTNYESTASYKHQYTSNVQLVANYSPKGYIIKYALNGGSHASDNYSQFTCTYGTSSCTLSKNVPVKTGYVFEGWEYNGYIYAAGATIDVDATHQSTLTFAAKWSNANKYNINYTLDGGTFSGVPTTSFLAGDRVVLSVPTKAGYTFSGWYSGNTQVINTAGKTADISVTARWTKNTYSVYLYKDVNGVDKFTVTCTYDENCDLSYTPANYFENAYPDYNFKGWSTSENGDLFYGDGITVKNISEGDTVKLYPVLEEKESSIYYLLEGGEFGSDVTLVTRYVPGDTVTLPTPTREGYTFVGWVLSDDESYNYINDSLDTATLGLTDDIALVALWSGQSYSVNYHYITRDGYKTYSTNCNYGSTCTVGSIDNSDSIYKDWTYTGPGDAGIITATEGDNYTFDYVDGFDSLDLYMTEATAVSKTIEYIDLDERVIDVLDIGYSIPVNYTTDSIYVKLEGLYSYSRDNSISSWLASGDAKVILVTEDDQSVEYYLITDGFDVSLTASVGPTSGTNAQLTFYNLDGNKILYGDDDSESVPLNAAGKLNVDSTYADNDVPQIDQRAVFVYPWYINGFKVNFDELIVYPSTFLDLYLGFDDRFETQPTHFD